MKDARSNEIITINGIEIDYCAYSQMVTPDGQIHDSNPLTVKTRSDGKYYIYLEFKGYEDPPDTKMVSGYFDIPFETAEAADKFWQACSDRHKKIRGTLK